MDGIGKIILKEREKLGISQTELCGGICSVATLSRLEWGEQNIGKWSIDVLMQRLGKSQDNFWTIVHIGDYTLLERRRTIWNAIIRGEYEEAEWEIQEYENSIHIQNIHEQFLVECRGIIKGKRDKDWKGAAELLTKAIRMTVAKFAPEKTGEVVIGRDEMMMILLLAEAYTHLGQEEIARQMVEGLLKGIQKKEWEEEELVKIYPKVIKVYVEFLKKEDKYEEVVSLSQKAMDMLIDNGIIFLLAELMEGIIWGMERRIQVEERQFSIREEQDHIQLKKHIEVLKKIWEEYGTFPEENMLYLTNVQKDLSVSNEIIGKCRKLCNLSQEKLSEDVCTVEHLSRIENGRCSPVEKNYRGLMEKMNQAQERNRFFINSEEYDLYEKTRQITKLNSALEYRKALEAWKEIRERIPQDSLKNKQYVMWHDTLLKYSNNEIKREVAVVEYREALGLTMPDKENADIVNWPLSRNEIFLLSNIAAEYQVGGRVERAIEIYDKLRMSFENSQVNVIYCSVEYILILYNLSLALTEADKEEESYKIIAQGLKCCMESGRFNMTAYFLYSYAWALNEDNFVENKKKARTILEQAFFLSNILDMPKLSSQIRLYYKECWEEEMHY